MLKKHSFWIKTAAVFQILTAAMHSLSFIGDPQASNETEKQLVDLMTTYRMDLGGGFTPTMENLYTAMSACFVMLLVFGAAVNWYMLSKKVDAGALKGLIHINLVIFGACFLVMAFLTFLPPTICTGLIFSALVLARLTFPKTVL